MAILKSLELKGNKLSFANFISNLSPCDTPFTSMIGKEAIDQNQYSWQTDTLAPATIDAFDEGSQAEFQPRASTEVKTNFTSILRKVANVSDTVASMSTYGRNKEMQYQLGKTGKELKRDMEFMTLNNGEGNIGAGATASKFSGFEFLCAGKGDVDPDTGAVTHKTVNVGDLTGSWFKASDLFDLTYNLYLAGSKANKIMFHPQHATTFSDFVSNNIEAGKTYRMFDNLDTKYNTQITKVRDPLGQVYDLIPNRFMPKHKIYIFNENDWTQTILRAPCVTKLSKKGSSERYMIETEIGLRHRHLNASGVLDMDPSNLLMEWTSKPTPIVWGLTAGTDIAEITVKYRDTGLPVADATVINWTSSNPAVLELTDSTGHTGVGTGEATNVLKPLRPGTSIITAQCEDGSASYLVTVKDPGVKLTMSSNLVGKGGKTLAIVKVTDGKGAGVDGVTVNFTADPFSLVNMPERSGITAGGGIAQVEVNAAQELGLVQVQASVGAVKSNYAKLEIVENVEALILRIDQRNIAQGINDSSVATLSVVDAAGAPIAGQSITVLSTNENVIRIPSEIVNTGAGGQASIRLTAGVVGDTIISAQYKGQEIRIPMVVAAPDISLNAPANTPINVAFDMSVIVTRSDGSDVVGVDVSFTGDPAFNPAVADVATDNRGVARTTYTPTQNSDIEVTASVGAYSDTLTVSVEI